MIGASSFASPLHELGKVVESIELYVPKLQLYDGSKLLRNRVDELRDILSTISTSTTLHAPYSGITPGYPKDLMVDTAHMGNEQWRLMEENISLGGEFGCNVVVVHPGKITGDREECFTCMVANVMKLARMAENCGTVIGLENLGSTDPTNLCCTAEELLRAIEEVNSPWLQATFDIGHANLTCNGDAKRLLNFTRLLGDSVVHVHVHDNNGRIGGNYFGDMHGAPGEGNIDFSVLRELRFRGVYNLEVFSMEGVRKGKSVLEGVGRHQNLFEKSVV